LAKTVTKPGHLDRQRVDPPRAQSNPRLGCWKKGIVEVLAPYSPELNRIEKLWWLMSTAGWRSRRTKVELEHTVNHILTNFGSQFKMAF
jgi:transposase